MATLREHIWFSQAGLTPAKREILLEHFGSPSEIHLAGEADFAGIQGIDRRDISALTDKSFAKAEEIIADCERIGANILTRQDSGYPERLSEIADPPQVLYVMGSLPDIDSVLPVAVVGTRRPPEYGLYMSDLIATQLANAGALVVSGMAEGIDSTANRAAIRAGKPTVAVMGCGPDICYPSSEHRLWEEIMRNGAVITEYPPGTPPYGGNFLERNRIISGLSLAVVLISVGNRSGAMNTAAHALRQGREIYCVPGNVDRDDNAGVTKLIKNGAGVAENASDILEGFTHMFPSIDLKAAADRRGHFPPTAPKSSRGERYSRPARRDAPVINPPPPPKPAEPPAEIRLEGAKGLIYGAVDRQPVHIDKICEATGLSAREALAELLMLEMDGLMISRPGKFFAKV